MPTNKPLGFTVHDRGDTVAPKFRFGVRFPAEGSQFLFLTANNYTAYKWAERYQNARADGLTHSEAFIIANA